MTARTIFAVAAALVAPFAAFGSTDCARIDNDLDRLACYDRESGRTPQERTRRHDQRLEREIRDIEVR